MDIRELADAGVDSVMDLMTKTDHLQRAVDKTKMVNWYKKYGINNHMHFPISDINERDYIEYLYKGACFINDFVENKNHKLFVHCTTGVSRGPTLILVYLSLFCKHENYDNLGELYDFLELEY